MHLNFILKNNKFEIIYNIENINSNQIILKNKILNLKVNKNLINNISFV